GATSYTFAATFSDNAQLTTDALTNLMIVTGPGGFAQAAVPGAVNSRTVSFTFTPPGGSWSSTDSGTYTISMEGNKVGDGAGNFLPAQALGTFDANVPIVPLDLGTFGQVGKKFGGKKIVKDTLAPGSEVFYGFTLTGPARV